VPYQYDILHRLRFAPEGYPRLRTLTQAGGRLADPLVADFHRRMSDVGGRLYVMYGQTEAGPRMTVLPPERLPDKLGSVGLPVPGATITVEDEEVVFRSPAVMMGYAEQAADLARGDDHSGVLHTGDLGRLDDEGFLYLTGRRKRIAKVFGVRVSLDDVERLLAHHGPVAAVAGDDIVVVVVAGADDERAQKIRSELAAALGTHSAGIRVRAVEALPRTASGKVDYPALTP
jgi:acyl-CoA synthetase (AMP-forming)/AMP-acid ligase II